jgi:hypothetical protein
MGDAKCQGTGARGRGARTLSIFSNESARRGVQPSMASPATAESQAGQPAATCSPRALLAKLPPRRASATVRDDRDRLSFRAGFSATAAAAAGAVPGCPALSVPAPSCGAAWSGLGWGGGRSGVGTAAGRPWTQPMGWVTGGGGSAWGERSKVDGASE